MIAVEVCRLVLEQAKLVRTDDRSSISHVGLPLLLAAIFGQEAQHNLGTAHLVPIVVVEAVLDVTSSNLLFATRCIQFWFAYLVALERIAHL